MAKRPTHVPDRSEITDDTPLHLATVAAIAFPDGSVSALALRNAAARGELEHLRIGGRVLTTLGWIKNFLELCRQPVRPRADPTRSSPNEQKRTLAVARARRVLEELRSNRKLKR